MEQIIGDRTLGLMIIDEAHIVTTWGKQFRPDYWYLGDHLGKIKKLQLYKKGMGFVIATFTATAIYGGIENMYEETIESLKMIDPITYIGFIKRDDITINIEKAELIMGRTEYELEKFEQLINKIDCALMLNKKMLMYFPTVALIERFYQYSSTRDLNKYISRYHGQMKSYEKEENYQRFLNNETPIMLATKAFGMGIDIDDIEIVAHFAPTGNVCDYVQEIGRAARKPDLKGEAYYKFMKNDFKHINRLHGLSILKEYQLVEVIRKVYELYQENIRVNTGKRITKKRNEMLIDAESFAHIFDNPFYDVDDGINKVKTAMLLIQKDFERIFSFSPFHVRPIPLFESGFFKIDPITQKNIKSKYGMVLQEVDSNMNICSVNLKNIWEHSFNFKYSFPKFKYMLYSKDEELNFNFKEYIKPALCIDIKFEDYYLQKYENYIGTLKTIINRSIREERFFNVNGEGGLIEELMKLLKINIFKANHVIETMLSAMSVYQRDYSKSMFGRILIPKLLNSGEMKYRFSNNALGFFRWIDIGFKNIYDNIQNGTLYIVDESGNEGFKEKLHILGILESLNVLVFKALGGRNSQIYIYVNQTKTMKEIIDKPWSYKNRLLELIGERHQVSTEMLTYIYEGDFTNEEIWNLIEDYFLGIIPQSVVKSYEKKKEKVKLQLTTL
ncbi:MAG: helicase-related protein [Tepidanaerobacteraceae bacterium]